MCTNSSYYRPINSLTQIYSHSFDFFNSPVIRVSIGPVSEQEEHHSLHIAEHALRMGDVAKGAKIFKVSLIQSSYIYCSMTDMAFHELIQLLIAMKYTIFFLARILSINCVISSHYFSILLLICLISIDQMRSMPYR